MSPSRLRSMPEASHNSLEDSGRRFPPAGPGNWQQVTGPPRGMPGREDGEAPPRRRDAPKKKKKLVSTKNQLRSVERLLAKARALQRQPLASSAELYVALMRGAELRVRALRRVACAGQRQQDARRAGAAPRGAAQGAGGRGAQRAGAQTVQALP